MDFQTAEHQTNSTGENHHDEKILIILLKIFGAIVIAFALFLATVFIVNVFSNKSEEGKIKPYGQFVAVDGKNMNVLIQGEGKETVVLLPGYGTPAPALDFKPLIDELSPFYKVVVIEPFGYGLSDITEKSVPLKIWLVKFMKRYSNLVFIITRLWLTRFQGYTAWIM